jgi:hypothetical protein
MYHGEQFKIVACIFFQMPKSIKEIKYEHKMLTL